MIQNQWMIDDYRDTIPTAPGTLDSPRPHRPDPRPKWAFRFTVVALVFVLGLLFMFPNLIVCRF